MSDTLRQVQALVARGEVRVSSHGYDELAADGILAVDAVTGVVSATAVEDYPDAGRGPSVLVLQQDSGGNAVHVVWGIPKGTSGPAVLVTAYRPNESRWSADFTRRKGR